MSQIKVDAPDNKLPDKSSCSKDVMLTIVVGIDPERLFQYAESNLSPDKCPKEEGNVPFNRFRLISSAVKLVIPPMHGGMPDENKLPCKSRSLRDELNLHNSVGILWDKRLSYTSRFSRPLSSPTVVGRVEVNSFADSDMDVKAVSRPIEDGIEEVNAFWLRSNANKRVR